MPPVSNIVRYEESVRHASQATCTCTAYLLIRYSTSMAQSRAEWSGNCQQRLAMRYQPPLVSPHFLRQQRHNERQTASANRLLQK